MCALPTYAVRGWLAVSTGPPDTTPLFWMDESLTKRVVIEETNISGGQLHDHLITATVPASVDAGSMTLVELAADRSLDVSYVWRYVGGINRMPTLPVALDSTTATFKAPGLWSDDETRYFALYWDPTGSATRYDPPHLRSFHRNWTAAFTAGTTGDTYRLVIGGTNYTHVMTAGQTATQIAQAMLALINAGADAVASGGSSTLTIDAALVHDTDPTFTVTNSGTTVPGNVVLTSPPDLALYRYGPDTDVTATTQTTLRLPLRAAGLPSSAESRAAIVRASAQEMVRLFSYKKNGDATEYGFTGGTLTAISWDGPTVTVSATLTGSAEWSGTYTAVFQNKMCSMDKADGTTPNGVLKLCDLVRVDMTLTCISAYTPLNDAGSGTSVLNQFVLSVTSGMAFTGNVTTLLADRITQWYASTSTGQTAITTASDTAALTVNGSIVGHSGNTGSMAVLIHSAALSGFSPQSPILKWWGSDLQLASTSSASQIPLGATITLDFTFAHSPTTSPTTIGDNMVGREMVGLLQSLGHTPTTTVATTETVQADSLYETMEAASVRCVTGMQWLIDNALTYTNNVRNIAYAAQPYLGLVERPDDDDGSYGIGHMVHGLCLRYLRTHDPDVIPVLEACLQFHLDIEADAISVYGPTMPSGKPTSGSTPYWYNPFLTAFTHDAGDVTQPGEPRPHYSVDQMHMVAHGLYAYLYLLRNEPAITANTALRSDTLAFLGRMRDDAEMFVGTSDASRVCGNLYAICTGATPTNTNGITDSFLNTEGAVVIGNPYNGQSFNRWQLDDGDNIVFEAASNGAVDFFFRGLYSPDSTVSGVRNYMQGRSKDMLAGDIGHHDVVFLSSWGIVGPYPKGWLLREGASENKWRFSAGRPGDDHYFELNSGGEMTRDTLTCRSAQRMVVLGMAALLDPTFMVPIEMSGGTTVVREVNVVEAINDMARTLALYGADPLTKAQRHGAPAYGGRSKYQWVDVAMNGWWMMGNEIWHLVNAGVDIADYYPIGSW